MCKVASVLARLVHRAAVLREPYNTQDSILLIKALSSLRTGLPSATRVCERAAFSIAATAPHTDVAPAILIDLLNALAHLNALQLPVVHKVLLPRLCHIPLHGHALPAQTLQKAALVLLKLGRSPHRRAVAVGDHVLHLLHHAHQVHQRLGRTDEALCLAYIGLFPYTALAQQGVMKKQQQQRRYGHHDHDDSGASSPRGAVRTLYACACAVLGDVRPHASLPFSSSMLARAQGNAALQALHLYAVLPHLMNSMPCSNAPREVNQSVATYPSLQVCDGIDSDDPSSSSSSEPGEEEEDEARLQYRGQSTSMPQVSPGLGPHKPSLCWSRVRRGFVGHVLTHTISIAKLVQFVYDFALDLALDVEVLTVVLEACAQRAQLPHEEGHATTTRLTRSTRRTDRTPTRAPHVQDSRTHTEHTMQSTWTLYDVAKMAHALHRVLRHEPIRHALRHRLDNTAEAHPCADDLLVRLDAVVCRLMCLGAHKLSHGSDSPVAASHVTCVSLPGGEASYGTTPPWMCGEADAASLGAMWQLLQCVTWTRMMESVGGRDESVARACVAVHRQLLQQTMRWCLSCTRDGVGACDTDGELLLAHEVDAACVQRRRRRHRHDPLDTVAWILLSMARLPRGGERRGRGVACTVSLCAAALCGGRDESSQ